MQKKKKKVDYEALNSPFMRIPRMDIAVSRALLDLGLSEIYDLKGRAPEILLEETLKKDADFNAQSIRYFRLAVYYSENSTHNAHLLHPDAWI
tara:strand:+ start:996 stop:1274 length:279 start_codon:yes stop_codon:yes gene_type:complete